MKEEDVTPSERNGDQKFFLQKGSWKRSHSKS